MPALATSQTATVNITTPGGYITVTCGTGDVMRLDWTSPGSISGSRTVRQVTEDVGPFPDSTVVNLRALSGSPQYEEGLTTAQTAVIQSLVAGVGLTGATYDGTGRLIAYTAGGVPHTITYPTTTTAVISNDTGASRAVVFNAGGRVSSIV